MHDSCVSLHGRLPSCQRHPSCRPPFAHASLQNLGMNYHRWQGLANASRLRWQGCFRQTLLQEKTLAGHFCLPSLSLWPQEPIVRTSFLSRSAISSRPCLPGVLLGRTGRKACSGSGVRYAVGLRPAGGEVMSDVAWLGGRNEILLESSAKETAEIGEHEVARRRKISAANKNRVPWNKGRKWSEDMKVKIRLKTRLAMQDPELRLRLKENALKQMRRKAMSPEVKAKIGASLVPHHQSRTAVSLARKHVLAMWQAAIGEAAQQGSGPGEMELVWVSSRTVHYSTSEGFLPTVPTPIPRKRRTRVSHRGPRSEEHRKRIAEAIREKWMDPSYRERVLGAMAVLREEGSTEMKPKTPRPLSVLPLRTKSGKGKGGRGKVRLASASAEDPITFEGVPPTADPAFLAAVMEGDEGGEGEEGLSYRRTTGAGRSAKVRIVNRLGGQRGGEGLEGRSIVEDVWAEHEEVRKLREAAQEGLKNARLLLAEAVRATSALQGAADLDDHSAASLAEANRYLESAAQSIAEAESQPCEPNMPAGIFSYPLGSVGPHERALCRRASALAGEGGSGMKEYLRMPFDFSDSERRKAFENAHRRMVGDKEGKGEAEEGEGRGGWEGVHEGEGWSGG